MDDVIALRDALLEDILDAEFGRADLRAFRANLDALIAAVEARAAGSLVERVEGEPCHATMLCPYPKGHPIHADEGEHEYRPAPPPGQHHTAATWRECKFHPCDQFDDITPPAPDPDRPANWSSEWRDDVTGAGFTRDEAITALTEMAQRYGALRKAGLAIFPDADMLVEGDRITMDRAKVEAFSVALMSTPPDPEPDRCPVEGCDELPEDHYHPAPDDRLRALGEALDHAEKNLGVIALTLTNHPEYPMKAADVDAARSLARFTAQDIRAARALLADGERSE